MSRSRQGSPRPERDDDAPPSLRVEAGETVVLSAQSERFGKQYRRVQPRSADEARQLIGLSDEMAHAIHKSGGCCQPANQPTAFPAPHELESDDELERGRAFDEVGRGFNDYLLTASPELFSPMHPAIERFLDLTRLELNTIKLLDIEIADGATLAISDDTHLIEANKVVIHGNGQLKLSGYTKMNVNSLEGV